MPNLFKEFYWNQPQAIDLCRKIREFAPKYGFHVALTGGCLYKDGLRKDADILVYRIRQQPDADFNELLNAMSLYLPAFEIVANHGFVTKAKYFDKTVDILFPEASYDLPNKYYGSKE